MHWESFIWFALSSVACWLIGAAFAFQPRRYKLSVAFTFMGIALFSLFIIGLWLSLERPPMRTMGETRLWYALFLPVAGLVTFIRWRYRWTLWISALLSFVFICINLFKPEMHDKALMPALQSPWFVPHVVVYMIAYSLFSIAFIHAFYLLVRRGDSPKQSSIISLCDHMVYLGTALLTIGMLLGALWAKAAWGHYWSWDPKETWAAATWMAWLLYIHDRLHKPEEQKTALWIVVIAFVILQICWVGVNYLPWALENSTHIYD